jgi:hypothetical protein
MVKRVYQTLQNFVVFLLSIVMNGIYKLAKCHSTLGRKYFLVPVILMAFEGQKNVTKRRHL